MGAAIRGIRHLIHYFKGGNADNVTMDMTVPFSSVIRFGSKGRDTNEAWTEGHALDAMDCESGPFRKKKPCPHRKPKVDFGLYLPDKYQGSAPEPALCSQVRVAHVPEYSVAVRSFGGHATPGRVKHELHALFKSLDHFKSTLRVDYKVGERWRSGRLGFGESMEWPLWNVEFMDIVLHNRLRNSTFGTLHPSRVARRLSWRYTAPPTSLRTATMRWEWSSISSTRLTSSCPRSKVPDDAAS